MKLLARVVSKLEQMGAPCALIGGVALAFHGIDRATEDIDLLSTEPSILNASVSSCGIPAGARAISTNVTVTGSTAAGYLSTNAADQAQPVATTLSFRVGQTRANNAMLSLALDGTGGLKVLNGSPGSVHVIIDVNGYFQ